MKNKRTIRVFAGIFCMLLMCGCYEPLEITDEEMDIVAEYAAGVLVEYGTQTTEKLLDREEQEKAKQLSATPTPRPTLVTAKPTDTVKKEDGEKGEMTVPTKKVTPTPVPDNTEYTMEDLTKLLAQKDFYFCYTGYSVTEVYQGAGDLFAAADEGKQLIVLEFEVTNRASEKAVLEMNRGAERKLVYTLRVGDRAIKPSLTLLQEDMYTSYKMEYDAGEMKKTVLVFECPKEEKVDRLLLTVLSEIEEKEDSVLIKIK